MQKDSFSSVLMYEPVYQLWQQTHQEFNKQPLSTSFPSHRLFSFSIVIIGNKKKKSSRVVEQEQKPEEEEEEKKRRRGSRRKKN